jgi:hypothetical protein
LGNLFLLYCLILEYGEQAIDLAVENLGMEEIAKLIGKVSGKKVTAQFRTDKEVKSKIGVNPISNSQATLRNIDTWMNVNQAKEWGIPMLTFEEFLLKNKDILARTLG